ncbi:HvfC/BufC N-terminal domain-containing protein [Bremerella sp. P1]|uniref:HvfC/BufC N-terminal domain-containing protein n=1 Tax=Bremerella sp. P1 TaxID=3026424 RepID=UPI002367C7E6|nr:DNA-binding domain-containing protein [Bremerella sp. P1]WDI45139.1 DNA-binding domain-containing protein [Bremerella sp. P1]
MTDSKQNLHDLPVLQKWMQSVITHVDGVVEGIHSPEAQQQIPVDASQIESVVTPSQRRTSTERLEVYAHAYYARLVECLKSIYPLFAKTVGDELFDQFAIAYLQQHPSRSYTLNRLGDQFPDFLEETSPTRGTDQLGFEDFLVELAVAERTIDAIFDGPGVEQTDVLSPSELEGISPDQFAEATFQMVPCLRLHSFAFPVSDFITAIKQDPQADMPEASPSWLALTRRDYVVRRVPLSRWQYHLLVRLAEGQSVSQAIAGAVVEVVPSEDITELLAAAFQKFTSEQFFLAIEVPSERRDG